MVCWWKLWILMLNSAEVKKEYGFELVEDISDDYNAVVVAVSHKDI